MSSELLQQFLELTGCEDNEMARNYLTSTNDDLQEACELYWAAMESGAVGTNQQGANSAPSGGARRTGQNDMDFEYGDDGEVLRAPIPQREAVLSDFNEPGFHGGMPAGGGPIADMFRGFHEDAQRVLRAREQQFGPGGRHGRELKGNAKLDQLFSAPTAIMTVGTWQEIWDKARSEKKWILVNVQDMSEFASQRLNRDTWRDEVVQDVVRDAFVFWQIYHDSAIGLEFLNLYPSVSRFPAIVIVDPRTGRLEKTYAGFQDATDLMGNLSDFLEQHGHRMDQWAADASSQVRVSAPQSTGGSVAQDKKRARSTSDAEVVHLPDDDDGAPMDEDEALNRAIAESLRASQPTQAPPPKHIPGLGSDLSGTRRDKEPAGVAGGVPVVVDNKPATTIQESAAKAKANPIPAPVLPPEPAATEPETTRVMIKLPDGQRVARRFRKGDPVRLLIDFALASCKEAQDSGRPYELILPGTTTPLMNFSETIGDAGLANAAVAMRWSD